MAGLGNVGFRLVQSLVEHGESVVAIERRHDGDFVQAAREWVPVVLGNAATEETLNKAGAAGAKVVIAATDDDLTNLSIGLAAKQARPDCRVVVRVFDSNLAEKMERELGVDAVLSMSAAAAPTFVGAALPRALMALRWTSAWPWRSIARLRRTTPAWAAPPRTWPTTRPHCGSARPAPPDTRAATGDRLAPGDQVLGVWWRPFAPRGAL